MSLEAQLAALPGDVALASAFMSYAGPFPSQYREALAKQTWQKQVSCHSHGILLLSAELAPQSLSQSCCSLHLPRHKQTTSLQTESCLMQGKPTGTHPVPGSICCDG